MASVAIAVVLILMAFASTAHSVAIAPISPVICPAIVEVCAAGCAQVIGSNGCQTCSCKLLICQPPCATGYVCQSDIKQCFTTPCPQTKCVPKIKICPQVRCAMECIGTRVTDINGCQGCGCVAGPIVAVPAVAEPVQANPEPATA